jgi:hypothetical protein
MLLTYLIENLPPLPKASISQFDTHHRSRNKTEYVGTGVRDSNYCPSHSDKIVSYYTYSNYPNM